MSNAIARTDIKAIIKAETFQQNLKASLPPSVSLDRFTTTTLTAISNNPALSDPDLNRTSLYGSIVRAAQDGLLPDGREGVIQTFKNKDGGKTAQWMPMAYGLTKKLAKAGIRLETAIVCENDFFEQEMGDDPKIMHKPPALGKPRGEITGAYAIATFESGQKQREVMDRATIDKIRANSRAKDGAAWSQWFEMMARKSVGKRLAMRIGIEDEEVAAFLKRDAEEDLDKAREGDEPNPVAQEPETPAKRPSTLQGIIDQDEERESLASEPVF